MSDETPMADIDATRKERVEKLTLLQDLWNILTRNSYEVGDKILRDAIKHRFSGFLELRVVLYEKRGSFDALQRLDMQVTMRLRKAEDPAAPDSISFPVDAATLRDMYKRLEEPEEPAQTKGDNVTVIDCAKDS